MKSTIFSRIGYWGCIITLSLAVSACAMRPKNRMIASFQNQSAIVLKSMVSDSLSARGITGGMEMRGVNPWGQIGSGYTPWNQQYYGAHNQWHPDVNWCVNRANQFSESAAELVPMMLALSRCLQRQLMSTGGGLYSAIMPLMSMEGQAYMRYLGDPRNPTGMFYPGSYGYGYSHQSDPMGIMGMFGFQGF